MYSKLKPAIAAVALLVSACSTVGGASESLQESSQAPALDSSSVQSSGSDTSESTAAGTTDAGDSSAVVATGLSVKKGSLAGKTICFNFQALETEFWAAGKQAISKALEDAGAKVLEFNSNEDTNRQFEQINDCITQGVDGIIFIPQDGASADSVIEQANSANVPVVAFNRPPASDTGAAIVVVANNREIAKASAGYLVKKAQEIFDSNGGKKLQPLIMVGDLGDVNAVDRRKGYYDAIDAAPSIFEKTIEVETKWDATTGEQNLRSAMQANPNVDLIFTSSDFLFPQIQSVLSSHKKWAPVGDKNHVLLAGLDGDHGACGLIKSGYVDATGVQDLFFEAQASIDQLTKAIEAGDKTPDELVKDPGFALTQDNLSERENDMWGCVIQPPK